MEIVLEGWGENWQKARELLTAATQQGIAAITDAAARGQARLLATTQQAINQVNEAASQAAESVRASLHETLGQAEQFSDHLAKSLLEAIAALCQNWLAAHPLLAWFLLHPFWTLGLLLLSLLLCSGLLRVIARFTEQAWLAVFQSPFRLGHFLLAKVSHQRGGRHRKLKPDRQQERLQDILRRLDEIKSEQEALLAEMRGIILKTQSS
jgi:hypothetical protein